MTPKQMMTSRFINLGGALLGTVNDKELRFTPAINETGDLYVNIKQGRKFVHSITLDEFDSWATENVSNLHTR